MNQDNKIKCPNCDYLIDVSNILYQQIKDDLEKDFHNKLVSEKKNYESKIKDLKEKQENLDAIIDEKVREKIKVEKQNYEEQIKKDVEDQKSDEIALLKKTLEEKSDQLKEYNKLKTEIEIVKREKEELKDTIIAESEKEYNEKLNLEREKIQKAVEDKEHLKISERDQIIDQLKKQLVEAQRKAEQGSTQLQGEVQELAIEDWLSQNFANDSIEEIKKGARGADCLHIVKINNDQEAGSVYYESKRTKEFNNSWIEKLKKDMLAKKADIGVIVTDTMPKDMERVGQKKGIWICTLEEFKGLSYVLREFIIQVNNAMTSQENKSDKINLIYDFLTSNEFRYQIEAIVEGFIDMQRDLESERRSYESIWKKREKQIKKVLDNTIHMYSSIKGIAGNAIAPVKALELPTSEEINEN